MAHRGGARAKGTDGGDYGHRETIAGHYQISSTNKKRLKFCLLLHVVLSLFVLLKLSKEMSVVFDLPVKNLLSTIKLPKIELWEYAWLSSITMIIAAYLGLRKNYITPMKVYTVGTFILGICPLAGAIVYYSGDMKAFLTEDTRQKVEKFYGVPGVLIQGGFIAVTFLVHSLSIMFAVNLMRAWAPKKGKKKQ